MTDELKKLWLEQSTFFALAKTMDEARPPATSRDALAGLNSQGQEMLELWCAGRQQAAESLGEMVYWGARRDELARLLQQARRTKASMKPSLSSAPAAQRVQGVRASSHSRRPMEASQPAADGRRLLATWTQRVRCPQVSDFYDFWPDDLQELLRLEIAQLRALQASCAGYAKRASGAEQAFWRARTGQVTMAMKSVAAATRDNGKADRAAQRSSDDKATPSKMKSSKKKTKAAGKKTVKTPPRKVWAISIGSSLGSAGRGGLRASIVRSRGLIGKT
jgi:uncharacterized protein YukE